MTRPSNVVVAHSGGPASVINASLRGVADGSGYMATTPRKPGPNYSVYYEKVPLELVANSERTFPQVWLAEDRLDVSADFVRYARPLIGDSWPSIPLLDSRQRFARLEPCYAGKKLPVYVLQASR